jgi:hypothetical protein
MQPLGTHGNFFTFIFILFGASCFTYGLNLFASGFNFYSQTFLFGFLTFVNYLFTYNVIFLFPWYFS